jgi:hypothetical protein
MPYCVSSGFAQAMLSKVVTDAYYTEPTTLSAPAINATISAAGYSYNQLTSIDVPQD